MDKTDLLKSRIGMKLVRVGKMVRAIANQKFVKANYEITPEQFTVLTAILDHDGLYQRQIGAITLKDRPNITRIINILENKELVTRTPDTNKRKVFKINITEKVKKNGKRKKRIRNRFANCYRTLAGFCFRCKR